MSGYVLSKAADADIRRILLESIDRWGVARAERYILELNAAFENLAVFPNMGRNAGHLRKSYLQFQHDSHSVFYRVSDAGILVMRVLHARLRPGTILQR